MSSPPARADPSASECADFLEQIVYFIDNELDEADCALVRAHLDTCNPCLEQYDLQRTVKSIVARSCSEAAPGRAARAGPAAHPRGPGPHHRRLSRSSAGCALGPRHARSRIAVRLRRSAFLGALLLTLALLPVVGPARVEDDVTRGAASAGRRSRDVRRQHWGGTATVLDVRTHLVIKTLNIVPDRRAELPSIYASPDKLAFYLAVQQGVGEGLDQYVDDMFTTRVGRLLAVSWPELRRRGLVDLATGGCVAALLMDGYRTDHWGSRRTAAVLVSARRRMVHEYVMGAAGKTRPRARLRTFESGDTPHENNYTRNGKQIFHASIGRVYTPVDYPEVGPVPVGGVLAAVKAARWWRSSRPRRSCSQRRWDMGKELAEAGYPGMSSAVRPLALTPDEKTAFLQVSFLHGIVEFDLDAGGPDRWRRLRQREPARAGDRRREAVITLRSARAAATLRAVRPRSAHHGGAINALGAPSSAAPGRVGLRRRRVGGLVVATILGGAARLLPGPRPTASPSGPSTSRATTSCWVSMAAAAW